MATTCLFHPPANCTHTYGFSSSEGISKRISSDAALNRFVTEQIPGVSIPIRHHTMFLKSPSPDHTHHPPHSSWGHFPKRNVFGNLRDGIASKKEKLLINAVLAPPQPLLNF